MNLAATAQTVRCGDANGDGNITMADANTVVNYYLASDKSTVTINIDAANANGDDAITMADANKIVNMFLNPDTHEAVDLGLSVKWATCNIGANEPWEYGDYFAWGETTAKESYSWDTYSPTTCTDADGNLMAEYDAAVKNWGSAWRMPTLEEKKELLNADNCAWTWYAAGNTKYNGVSGYEVASKKSGYTDKSIFLPAAGLRYGSTFYKAGQGGYYWSATLDTNRMKIACCMYFHSDSHGWGYDYCCYGRAVRPVCP